MTTRYSWCEPPAPEWSSSRLTAWTTAAATSRTGPATSSSWPTSSAGGNRLLLREGVGAPVLLGLLALPGVVGFGALLGHVRASDVRVVPSGFLLGPTQRRVL